MLRHGQRPVFIEVLRHSEKQFMYRKVTSTKAGGNREMAEGKLISLLGSVITTAV